MDLPLVFHDVEVTAEKGFIFPPGSYLYLGDLPSIFIELSYILVLVIIQGVVGYG